MDAVYDSIAHSAVSDAAMYMCGRSPGMTEFYRIMRKRQSDEPNVTVRVVMENGHPVLEYGVAFVRSIDKSLLGSILYMQCMKVALHHCDKRRKEPSDVYKLASDLVVAEYGKNLVDCSVPGNIDIINKLYPTVWTYWDRFREYNFDTQKDLYLERVFEILIGINANEPGNADGDDDSGETDSDQDSDESDGESDNDGATGSDDSSDEESDDGDGDSDTEGDGESSDKGDGDDTGSDSDSDENDDANKSFEAMQRYFSGENAEDDISGWERDELCTGNIQAAAARADKSGQLDRMAGNLPVMIADANAIKVNVEALFRHFVDSVDDDDYELSWSRRDRRLPRTPLIFVPGKIIGRTHKLLLAVDLSGSMYMMGHIANCIRLMNGIVNGLTIDVCYWDAVCSDIYATPKSMDEIELYGGGSTDPQCVLDKVHETGVQYDGIVFLTDCEFFWECPPRAREIMIIRAGNRAKAPEWCMHTVTLDELLHSR